MQAGDKIQAEITSIAYGGDGIARLNGAVCFIPETIPGEIVTAEITAAKKNYFKAELAGISHASPARIQPACPYARNHLSRNRIFCPGCQYMHMDYETEIACKTRQLSDLLSRMAGISPESMLPPIPSPRHLNYRNKVTLHTDRSGAAGYIADDNKTLVRIDRCLLACNEINDAISTLTPVPNKECCLKYVIRHTDTDGTAVIPAGQEPSAAMLTENTPFGIFRIPALSFFQVNKFLFGKLVENVTMLIKQTKPCLLIDLYCGTGVFGIAAAQFVNNAVGIEIDKKAIDTARNNALNNKTSNIVFHAGDSALLFPEIMKDSPNGRTTVLIDPPRTGLDSKLIDALLKYLPPSIIYVSCAPDTLCRDLKKLCSSEYNLKSIQMIDMFPRTSHFETIALIERKRQD